MVETAVNQARGLERASLRPARARRRPPVVAVTSGKGGVGKTNLVANTAALMAAAGQDVLLVDADYGLANLAVVLGVAPRLTLEDALEGRARLSQTVVTVRPGLRLVPAGSGIRRLAALSEQATRSLLAGAEDLLLPGEIVLVDTAAGIGPGVLATLAWADLVVMLLTDDPASFVDGYALTKLVYEDDPHKPLGVLLNKVRSRREGDIIHSSFCKVTERFLGRKPDFFGVVPQDPRLNRAVRRQQLLALEDPEAPASRAMRNLAEGFLLPLARRVEASLAGAACGGGPA